MKQFEILTDSTIDFMPKLVEEMDVTVIPMGFQVDGKEYLHYYDFREMSVETFYAKLKEGSDITTSQVTPARFETFFRPFVEEGKDFIYIGFSSGLSGTYGASLIAINQLKEEFPNVNMMAVDSLCASGGEGLAVYIATKMRKNGATMEEIAQWITQKAAKHIVHWISVDDLKQLARGGRISSVAASIGTMLHVKPILKVNEEGKLEVSEKCRGNKARYKNCVDILLQKWKPEEQKEMIIFHAQAEKDALYLRDLILGQEQVKQYNPEILISEIGPVVGGHTGRGCVCFAFYGTGR